MKQSVTVGARLLWGGHYGCNNGRYGCTIVMSYIEINKAVSQWLLTFNLCVSVTWPLTCAFHIPCTHTPEIIDMHRGVCDNHRERASWSCNAHLCSMRHCTKIFCRFVFSKVTRFLYKKWNSSSAGSPTYWFWERRVKWISHLMILFQFSDMTQVDDIRTTGSSGTGKDQSLLFVTYLSWYLKTKTKSDSAEIIWVR